MKITQKGFSLIELMVVVAIIGILATVAVPQVNKFMAKARQAESKSTLSGIYTAEKSFYTEYNTFMTYFTTIGFSPEGRVRYNAGFSAVGACAMPPGLPAGAGAMAIDAQCGASPTFTNGCSLLPEGSVAGAQALGATGGATACTATTFTAQARTNLGHPTNMDVWTVDQNKNMTQTLNGIP